MNRAAQVHTAIGILSSFEKSKKPLADMLRDWGRKNRFAGAKDRAAISGVVFETLRRYKSSAYILESQSPRARVLGSLWQYFDGDIERCAALFDGSQYGPARINEAEQHKFETTQISAAPIDIRADFPQWLSNDLRGTFGGDVEPQLKAFRERAPLDIRVNPSLGNRDELIGSLADLRPTAIAHTADGVRFEEKDIFLRLPNLETRDEFSAGMFDIQDGSSQICASMTANCLPQGGRLLDYCAGAGGKSLTIATRRDDVKITATDIDEARLKPLSVRAERAGLETIEIKPISEISGQYDCVLLDAPCSGSGTWRRKPETKWRLTSENLQQRLRDQKTVLQKAKDFVLPGGILIYATCSILECENKAQVMAFLDQNHDFELMDWRAYGEVIPEAINAFEDGEPFLQLSPLSSGTDGFFISILRKKP